MCCSSSCRYEQAIKQVQDDRAAVEAPRILAKRQAHYRRLVLQSERLVACYTLAYREKDAILQK